MSVKPGDTELRSRFLEEPTKAPELDGETRRKEFEDSPNVPFSRSEKIALASILTGSFITVWDYFAALVAVYGIQRELGVSDQSAQLILSIFGIAGAAGLITGGRLGDLYGRKRLFLLGMSIFAVGALMSAIASSAIALAISRGIQGLATALIQPQVLALLGTRFHGHKRRKAFAAFSVAMVLGAVVGQLTAAMLMSANSYGLGWRICFLASIPFCILAIILAWVFIRSMPRTITGIKPDWLGMVLSGVTLFLLTWTLTVGKNILALYETFILVVFSISIGVAFWFQQLAVARRGLPSMLPIYALRQSRAYVGLFAVFVFYLGVTSFYIILGWHLQRDLDMTPLQSGLIFALWGTGFFLSSILGPSIGKYFGRKSVAYGALLLMGAHGFALFADVYQSSMPALFSGVFFQGIGMGFVMAPLTSLVLSNTPSRIAGAMSGVIGSIQAAGNAVGVAIVPLPYLSKWQLISSSAISGSFLILIIIAGFTAALSYRTATLTDGTR